MYRRKLACSFCRRNEAHVTKLVAGPRVYICDRCAAEAVRIMADSDDTRSSHTTARQESSGTIRRLLERLWPRGSSGTSGYRSVANAGPYAV